MLRYEYRDDAWYNVFYRGIYLGISYDGTLSAKMQKEIELIDSPLGKALS